MLGGRKGGEAMKRILGRVCAATVLCALVVIPLEVTSASALILGTGAPTCTGITGTFHFHPALKTTGVATNERVTITGKVFGCTGGTPPPTTGKLAGKGVIHGPLANRCSSYFPTGTMTFTSARFFVEVKWAGIVATTARFPTLTLTNPGGPTGSEIFNGT